MKTKVLLALAMAVVLMNAGLNAVDSPRLTLLGGMTAHAATSVDIDFFYDELTPYGYWRQIEPYGWVWYPDVAYDWRPYTIGYWVFTDEFGWTWISTEPWGSITYHYGRWYYDDDYRGWAWVPDTTWGPAWVSWRSGGGFIGWAPLPPAARFEPGVGFYQRDEDFGISWNSWCFVPTSRFLSQHIAGAIIPPPRNVTIINNTVNVTNYTFINQRIVNRSIDISRFEREYRRPVVRYRVAEVDRPVVAGTQVRDGWVNVFRPKVVMRSTATPPPPSISSPHAGAEAGNRPRRPLPDMPPSESRDRFADHPRRGFVETPKEHAPALDADRQPELDPFNRQRRHMDIEQARQRALDQQQAEQPRQRAFDQQQAEQARRRAEMEQARQQQQAEQFRRRAEMDQARQQQAEQAQQRAIIQQQQAEQFRRRAEMDQARQQRRLPDCKQLPPGQQQECR